MLGSISRFASGRRTKWFVLVTWVVVGLGLAQFQPKLQEATTNENEAFLPASAESTVVNDLVSDRFPDGREVDALIVYNRDGGLTDADRQRITEDALAIAGLERPDPLAPCSSELTDLLSVIDPFRGPVCGARELATQGGAAAGDQDQPGEATPSVSEDGATAAMLVRTNSEDSEEIQDNVTALRDLVPPSDAPEGELRAYVTGVAGIVNDSVEVFQSVDLTLLAVTVSLILVLLLLIYRSPVIALVPLFVVAIAYGIAAAAVYGLIQAGAIEVSGQTTALLIILMFGAGTDYCLLIVARYREELRQREDVHDAMARATERTAPAILSAGGTVVAAMLVLMLADMRSTASMGPVLALGIAIMIAAGLTLLPALLSCLGRRAFWPAVPRVGTEAQQARGIWRRIGHFVHDRPVLTLLVSVAVLAAGALGNLQERGILDFGEGFRNDPESVQGQRIVERELSAGQTAPTTVIAAAPVAERVAAVVAEHEGVDAAAVTGRSEDGELVRIDATLAHDPFSEEASDTIPALRASITEAAGGELALVGGLTAENFDTEETLDADARLVVPLVLAVIFLILCALLRALVAPLHLIATVVLSFAFAIGASTLIFTEIFNQPDSDPSLATFAFIFLVALGVDYNIFLISRIREEAHRRETKDAVIVGLERTGGVITSAGLILAGTFCALMTLPLEVLFQIGFTIALGLIVDTFLVRTILVPSIAFLLGERNWWPSRISHAGPVAPAEATAD
ncbi:MAG TPA: MMPL family transporter [Solirubrobacterales bacterium]